MRRVMRLAVATGSIPMLFVMVAVAADSPPAAWPPTVDANPPINAFPGRKVEYFRHGTRPEWGYAKPQQDFFILVHPEKPRPDSPLYVCLHSAGHDGKSAYEIGSEGAEGPRGHFVYHPPADCYGLYPDCRANGGVGDWWWGGPEPNQKAPKNMGAGPTPTERRVEDTVRWVLSQYPLDANRVYLTGISMGGSGSLGFGTPRGDLFASVLVHVPAGATHIQQRMRFAGSEVPGDAKLPDPPVVVAYSGVDDGWARDQATLINGMRASKMPFIDFWGRSGHDSTRQRIITNCDLAFSFPWLEIRRNEAYPVFTDATSDTPSPWLHPETAATAGAGQINGFFRWKAVQDTATQVSMELRLIRPDEVQSKFDFPRESTADVTLRRLQAFPIRAGQEYEFELVRDGKPVTHGVVKPDASGLLTIPRLTISQTPSLLSVKVRP